MRGKQDSRQRALQGRGLIPAYAGKTCGRRHRRPIRRAHPRVCGENCAWCLMWAGRGGSSPRMRGKRSWTVTSVGRSGLIPAYAEKTTPAWSGPFLPRAHPRVCGENTFDHSAATLLIGSSPRMRGKLAETAGNATITGLIPAYAGKTRGAWRVWSRWWAHPRVCGENASPETTLVYLQGSSPRMRGKHL